MVTVFGIAAPVSRGSKVEPVSERIRAKLEMREKIPGPICIPSFETTTPQPNIAPFGNVRLDRAPIRKMR